MPKLGDLNYADLIKRLELRGLYINDVDIENAPRVDFLGRIQEAPPLTAW